ncbi:ExbD/TolR family protein [Denitrobaculum tricleocarpae]|uniref:Biopolymer transporter ExbD n=1 Tax=Denitrobaculum tricleocarpae TaxID=2591009 RepID=A0A545TGE3_9PROT|nr:biopolymer transporter ExbD [Denitrobaculum tricleocarpae]TQV76302.1 biopolymer transporter ExbD [Denitrobaculum tricleocarpae]
MRLQAYTPSPPASNRLALRPRRRQLISLTPLIDVVFILLVFFMLASSFLDWRSIELNTPGTSQGGERLEGTLLIDIRPDGLRLSGETLSPEALILRVVELLAKDPERRILVRPADGVVMQETVTLLDSLSAAGVTDLSLIAPSAN